MVAAAQKSIKYKRPWMYPEQLLAIFNEARYSIIEASTKSGKTVGCIVWITEQAMQAKRPGQNYWWVAPISAQAKIAFRRLKAALPKELYTANETELTVTLKPNGAVIWFKGADKPDSLYGEDVYAAVIDEGSRVKEEAWFAVRSTLTATRGMLRIIGNVKGKKNWFYRLARRAEGGEKDMEFHRISHVEAVKAGILDKAEIDDARSKLPEAVFKELYAAEASDDEGNPFGITAIRKCIRPLSKAKPVAWGWDLAKSHDYTVGIGLDANGVVCRFVRFQLPWGETKARIIKETGKVPALVDSTGVGDPILEDIQRGRKNFQGFHFSSPSKQKLMEGLASAIQEQEIGFPGYSGQSNQDGPPDHVIVLELESFEYEYTRTGVRYSAPEGSFDDCVCALALARAQYGMPRRIWKAA